MINGAAGSNWTTIVLFTAILMIIFLLFFGSKPIENPLPPEEGMAPKRQELAPSAAAEPS